MSDGLADLFSGLAEAEICLPEEKPQRKPRSIAAHWFQFDSVVVYVSCFRNVLKLSISFKWSDRKNKTLRTPRTSQSRQ